MAATIVAWLQIKPKVKKQYILYSCVKIYSTSVDVFGSFLHCVASYIN